MTADLHRLTIAQLAPLLRERQLSPVELVEHYLGRIERLDPELHTYIRVMPDEARAAARVAEAELGRGQWRGPLHGVPIGLKDLFDVAHVPCTMGSLILRENVPTADATVVERLEAAGAIILGKHNLHEFAYGVTNENPHYGTVRNPWNPERVPGGSSGGTAAAIAAGLCVAGLGSDTGGSIRIPASFCGIVGLKPTYGRVSRAGVLPLSWSLDHVGPLARSVADCAAMLQAIAGPDPRDPSAAERPVPDFSADLAAGVAGLRLGVPREHYFELVEPDVARLVRTAIDTLAGRGAEIVDISLPRMEHVWAAGTAIMSAEAAAWHASWLRTRPEAYGSDVLQRIRGGTLIRATEYLHAQQMRSLVQADFVEAFERVAVILAPTLPMVAPIIGRTFEPSGPFNVPPRSIITRNTLPANVAGLPAASVPCGLSGDGGDGLPVGLQIIGPAFAEPLVLRVAAAYEQAGPGPQALPLMADASARLDTS